MTAAILLDRDGTINVNTGYCHRVEDFEFLPNAIAGLKKMQNMGFKLIILTNQSGIGRGYYTESEMQELHKYMVGELSEHGIIISKIYHCPHHPEAKIESLRKVCECRKPGTLMAKKAQLDYDLDMKKCFVVGDRDVDLEMGNKCGVQSILISKEGSGEFIAKDLVDAARIIENVRFQEN